MPARGASMSKTENEAGSNVESSGTPGGRSRREFLTQSSLGILGAAVAVKTDTLKGLQKDAQKQKPAAETPGTPPAYGTGPAVGPPVSTETFAQAEKLVQIEMSAAHRKQAADSWPYTLANVYERRTGPRKLGIEANIAPWSRYICILPGTQAGPAQNRFVRSEGDPGAVPSNEVDIAFATVAQLSRWVEQRKITSQRLTEIYLTRLEKFNPKLRCAITITREHALAQAKKADQEIGAGNYRGALHGIPFGVKDLLDTAGIATTWGAEPFRNRVPKDDSAVVKRLNDAGAVLVAKLSLGALALNDVWFGGENMNPGGVQA